MDLTQDLSQLAESLIRSRDARSDGGVILLTSPGEIPSAPLVSRELARLCARRLQRGVWLMDLDFRSNRQYRHFAGAPQVSQYGPLGKPLDASLGMEPFWRVAGSERSREAVTLHRVGRHRLFVSRFNARLVGEGAKVSIRTARDYWKRAREVCDLVVIDAPSPRRSRAGMALYGEADAVAFLVAGSAAMTRGAQDLAEEVELRGGLPAGLIVQEFAPRAA